MGGTILCDGGEYMIDQFVQFVYLLVNKNNKKNNDSTNLFFNIATNK